MASLEPDPDRVPERPRGVVRPGLTASAHASEAALADLYDYTAGLDAGPEQGRDVVRRWLALDWLARAAAPRWLRAIGQTDQAECSPPAARAGDPDP